MPCSVFRRRLSGIAIRQCRSRRGRGRCPVTSVSDKNRRAKRGQNRTEKPRGSGIPVIFPGGRVWRVGVGLMHMKAVDWVAHSTNTMAGRKLRFVAGCLISSD